MSLELHHMEISSPCRAVRLVIEALGLEINYKSVNLINGDHLTDEYREVFKFL